MASGPGHGNNIQEELHQSYIGIFNICSMLLDRIDSNFDYEQPKVLKVNLKFGNGEQSARSVRIIERLQFQDDVPGMSPSVRSLEFKDKDHTIWLNFQSLPNFTVFVNSEMTFCSIQKIPENRGEYNLLSKQLTILFRKIHEELILLCDTKGCSVAKMAMPKERSEYAASPAQHRKELNFYEKLKILQEITDYST
jgi:hypothetical protein